MAGDEEQFAEPQGRGADERAYLLDGAGQLVGVELDERLAPPAGTRPFEVGDRRLAIAAPFGIVGGGDVVAELPEVDLDVGWRSERHDLVVDPQDPWRSPCLPAWFEDGTQPRQRHPHIAPGGHRVEVRPHQLTDSFAPQRPGDHEQLEQGADPLATEVGERRRLPRRRR